MALPQHTTVTLKLGFSKWQKSMHDACEESIAAASEFGARRSRDSAPVGEGESGVEHGREHLRSTYEPTLPGKSRHGFDGGFGSSDPNSLWQELGTLARRVGHDAQRRDEVRRPLRGQRKGRARGVRPRRIMLRAVEPSLAAMIVAMREFAKKKRVL